MYQPTPQDPTQALIGHGHVRLNVNGVKARCGGPGLCSKCREEALALPRAEIIFQRTEDASQPLTYPRRYTITGKWQGDPQAAVEIASGIFSQEHLDILERHFGLFPIKMLGFSVLFLATQNQGVPLVIKCTQHGEGQIPDMEVVSA